MKFLITELNCLRLEFDYQYKCYCKARQYTSGIKLREKVQVYTVPFRKIPINSKNINVFFGNTWLFVDFFSIKSIAQK